MRYINNVNGNPFLELHFKFPILEKKIQYQSTDSQLAQYKQTVL